MLSMTSTSTGPFVGSSSSPSCSCTAVRSDGPSVSLVATPDDVLVSRMAGGRFGNLRQRAIGRLDLVIISGTPVLLTVVALIAIWIPAKRAIRVDPMAALRLE
jgi:hypothetical protein